MSALRPLKPALQAIAIKELNEVPQRVPDDIEALREWVLKQPHLRACTDERFLLAFLRGTKFSMERAKEKFDRFYTLQSSIPEVFNERRLATDPVVLDILRMGVLLRLPLDADDPGPCVTIIRAGSYDTSKYKFQDIIRLGSMFGEIMMFEDENATISGYVEIMDMTGVTGSHLFALQPQLLSKFSTYADEAMPTRQKGIHFINVPSAFETGFNSLRSFFPAKIKSRISVSSDPDAIFQIVSREYLPKEYGGTRGTMGDISEDMEAKLSSYSQYFEASQNFGTDEKLREFGNRVRHSHRSSFGAVGSFRKLEID
ncbi:GL26205 [Drosophila persimilis]|uniref:Retinol-binding protein pinta n=2 Tax=pseudoobscura subgroup TaxID=32358 RepID=Q29JW0_DROPS|nr:retinol-binding protein pinta [Drosophila persimilis]XP_026843854.1 retinol-binding protein pinta [Drosophila persimilis]XP_033236711.1 retinol-binding protein pinta [Drosophila pseudoobscura]XP_033236712.1 retinol-binding protein pinta [Drosophila pseudoobscura]EDW37337.1 GL26205 [Drosophila persimilis]